MRGPAGRFPKRAAAGVFLLAARLAAPAAGQAPARVPITAIETGREQGRSFLRLVSDSRPEVRSARRAGNMLLIALDGADLSAVAGTLLLDAPGIERVAVGDDAASGAPGLALTLGEGAVCDVSRLSDALLVECATPPEPVAEVAGDAGAPASGDAGRAVGSAPGRFPSAPPPTSPQDDGPDQESDPDPDQESDPEPERESAPEPGPEPDREPDGPPEAGRDQPLGTEARPEPESRPRSGAFVDALLGDGPLTDAAAEETFVAGVPSQASGPGSAAFGERRNPPDPAAADDQPRPEPAAPDDRPRPESAVPDDQPRPEPAAPTAGFSGEPVTLDFRDADLRDVLRLFGELSGLDFVIQPGVSGRVTIRLTEAPWDQALGLVLRTQGLGHVLEGGVLRVATLDDLAAERLALREHQEARELDGELRSLHRTLEYVSPEVVRPLLEERLTERGTLVADARSGVVLVADIEPRIREFETLLDALDVPVPGVEIEARIVLATRNLTQQLGVQWGGDILRRSAGGEIPLRVDGAGVGGGDRSGFTTGSAGGRGLRPPSGRSGDPRGYAVNLPIPGAPTGALGLAVGSVSGLLRLDLALTAAERTGEVRILSAPRIVAQEGEAATIKQGVTFPVQVVANNTVTVQFQDAVLELTVTPEVAGETVLLDLRVNNDALDFGKSVGGVPSIVTQHATTRVRVPDNTTAVVGGVLVSRESEERGRVPGLHRIPLLGHLFRSREREQRDEELLIFLTPRIRRIGATGDVSGAASPDLPGTVPESGIDRGGRGPEGR